MRVLRIILAFIVCVCTTNAETPMVLRGLSVYGSHDESNFPMVVNGKITIQFDVVAPHPPDLRIRFYHCNRNWIVDNNVFVNDERFNTSSTLKFKTSENGVRTYNYRYVNSFPDGEFVRFEYSGNWIFRIMDEELTTVFAEGRFLVAETSTPTTVVVKNEYLTANAFPYNQIHSVTATAVMADELDGYNYTTVDVYQNRRLHSAIRIDAWDRDPYTKVEGHGSGKRIFTIRNILPGNEYRILDLSSATRYPNYQFARSIDGPDLARHFWRTGSDRNGEATLNRYTGVHSEYLDYQFRLDLPVTERRKLEREAKDIFVVGEFNFWSPGEEDMLTYDEKDDLYVVEKQLRRGIYDYQYVAGRWNATTRSVEQQDWTAIEGTDVRTTNTYTACVYYNDPRFGGFDRIVGWGQATSEGTSNVGSQ